MASQYLFGGVKSREMLCLYPIGEPHGFMSDFSGQMQVTGTVIKSIYTQQVMPAYCMFALSTFTRFFILRSFILGKSLFNFRFGVNPLMKSPLEFLFPFFLTGHLFSPFFAFVCSRMLCQCTPPLCWMEHYIMEENRNAQDRTDHACDGGERLTFYSQTCLNNIKFQKFL